MDRTPQPDLTPPEYAEALTLHESSTLIGYGREGHGLNGKDADLLPCGQIEVTEAYLFAGYAEATVRPYALACPPESYEAGHLDSPYVTDWDGDCWVLSPGTFTIRVDTGEDGDLTTDEAIDAANRLLDAAIERDDTILEFQQEVASVAAMFDAVERGEEG